MKHFKNYLSYAAVIALLFTSCSKDENVAADEQQTATLTLGAALQEFNKSTTKQQDVTSCIDGDPAIAELTLEYGDDQVTVNVPVLGDEVDGYFTAYHEDLEIPVPANETHVMVELVDFVVWTDEDGDGEGDNVLWVAPKWDSEYAQFVSNPLGGDNNPYIWNLRAGSKTYVDVEVLCFNNREANKFGYQFFDITPVPMVQFCMFGNVCPDGPDGKHKVASYQVNVWEYRNGAKGDELYDETVPVLEDNGTRYADPLCLQLPDREGEDTYWFEVTILDVDGYYNSDDRIILQGSITDSEIKTFYEGNNALEYYHFQYGCGEDVQPPFYDPQDEAEHYSACIKAFDDGDVLGYAYFTRKGDELRSTVWTVLNEANVRLPQNIHENADCSSYGDEFWALDLEDGQWPLTSATGWLNYDRNFMLTADEANALNLENRTYVLQNDAGTAVACGEINEID